MQKREAGVLPPERRRALLEEAAAEFAESGYERASLNRIIRARGMSKSSFYHYFDSKEALFNAVVGDVGAALASTLDLPSPAELADGDFWARIRRLTARLAKAAKENPVFATLPKLFYLPDAPRSLARTRARIDDWIDGALEAGRSAGAVGDDLPASLQRELVRAVLWVMDEWSVANMDDLTETELDRLADAQLEAIRRLLAPSR
ncbi:TetR/AcrR family transcriptional regulator [Glycomyces sp. L485]|uniref:TetR/AcrR family transcriptional regulator n=1 Tax=Glycomyces sp. L485 TaxID=2909235 RepID=UPI001F4A2C38|nr:TetR/AcrR family transcriptional regulator [Glycomyces sp. L485]MCH7232425.1 TetR/AcrR family transcriptional regulator [Glycomyces sp. L485]